jgi:outer membrane protein assembly factor BamB
MAMAMTFRSTAAVLIGMSVCAIVSLVEAGEPETWPQWRGPHRDGSVSDSAAPWPESLQEQSLSQRWRIELPPSYSGPVVSADKVFVTYTRDEKYEGVIALDRERGNELWKAEWEGAMQVASLGASMGSWIRATPAFDGQYLFVAGMPDLLLCLDASNGARRWHADFHQRYGTPLPELGFVCSPLVDDEAVYVQTADSFVKVDKKTGESVWRCLERQQPVSEEGMGQGSYSSPNYAVVHGRPQLLVANIEAIAGVDPANGEVLWTRVIDSYDQGCVVAPVAYRDGIFASSRASRTGFYPLTKRDGQFTIADGWKNKLAIYMSSPVVIGNFAYAHLKNERFACIDLRDGTINWISNRTFGRYCSMAYGGERILALTNDGELLLIHADPDRFVLADSRTVAEEETWGHLAVAGHDVYIRERNAIAAYRWQ